MNVLEVKQELERIPMLNEFIFDVADVSLFATAMRSEYIKHTKIKGGDETWTGPTYYLFVGHMYPGANKEFFYMTILRKDRVRKYRCRTWNEYEANKIYASGNTAEKLIESLNKWINKGYILS